MSATAIIGAALAVSGSADAQEYSGRYATQFTAPSGSHPAFVAFSASNFSVTQRAGFVTFTVERGAAPGTSTPAVSVNYVTVNGSAVAGMDYTLSSGKLMWAADDVSPKTISVPISTAHPFAGDRFFNVALTDPSDWYAIKYPNTATGTITGDAVASTGGLELSDAAYSVAQNAGSVTISVTRVGGANGAASVSYATANVSAIAGQDYTATSGLLKWADGDATSKSFSVPVSGKTPFASNKTFAVALAAPAGSVTLDQPTSAIVTIAGDSAPSAGTLSMTESAYSVAQNAGSVTLSVERSGGANGAVSVAYSTANGSATSGTNYTASKGTLEWASGDTATKSFAVPVSNGAPFAGSKTFSVALATVSGNSAVKSPGTSTVTIDGDAKSAAADLEFSSSTYTVAQSAGSVKVTVDRTGGSTGAASVAYATSNGSATAGANYTAQNGTLEWAAGDASSRTITVPVSTSAFSGSKTFEVALSAASGASIETPSSASVTITGSGTIAPASSGSVAWVYDDGVFDWGGDYSSNARINYSSTAGSPESGSYDIAVTITGKYGLFLPYAGGTVPHWDFDSAPYHYLTVDLKPTVANQSWQLFFEQVGDKNILNASGQTTLVNLANYGPAPVVGRWATYKIPLTAVLTQYSGGSPVLVTAVYKFGIQDQTGLSSNTWYVDNMGFTVN